MAEAIVRNVGGDPFRTTLPSGEEISIGPGCQTKLEESVAEAVAGQAHYLRLFAADDGPTQTADDEYGDEEDGEPDEDDGDEDLAVDDEDDE